MREAAGFRGGLNGGSLREVSLALRHGRTLMSRVADRADLFDPIDSRAHRAARLGVALSDASRGTPDEGQCVLSLWSMELTRGSESCSSGSSCSPRRGRSWQCSRGDSRRAQRRIWRRCCPPERWRHARSAGTAGPAPCRGGGRHRVGLGAVADRRDPRVPANLGPPEDELVVALVLRYAARRVPREVLLEAWPAAPRILGRLLPGRWCSDAGGLFRARAPVCTELRDLHHSGAGLDRYR
jgi:hypothetical protein